MTDLTVTTASVMTISDAGNMLRYVERDGERVLQQSWEVKTVGPNNIPVMQHVEWRDVPLEKE